jgi:hypothetical protein
MSDNNIVMPLTTDRQPRLGIAIGCILALACLTVEPVSAQVVKAAGENHSETLGISAQLAAGASGKLTSRRVLPKLQQKDEISPSDAQSDDESDDKKVGEKYEKSAAESDNYDVSTGIVPVQSAGLRLTVDRVNIATKAVGTGTLPEDTAGKRAAPISSLLDGQSRGIVVQQVNWRPAAICHLPLYFEDAMLERHGHVRWGHAQPVVSGAKFLTTIPFLPYIATLQPKCEPRYTLGHFRPGSCAPALKDHLPWDRRAATVEVISLGAFFWASPL